MKTYELKAEYIPEPLLSFGHGQESDYTKDGLFFFCLFVLVTGGANARRSILATSSINGRTRQTSMMRCRLTRLSMLKSDTALVEECSASRNRDGYIQD